jgi:uncharacterized membrane protein YcaP (DUF421 family)
MASVVLHIIVAYVYLLTVIRLAGKRVVAEGTPFDLVVAFIVGDMPDDMIWGGVPVAQGLVAMGAVISIHLIVTYAASRSEAIHRLVASAPLAVISQGTPVRRAQARERVPDAELQALLRAQEVKTPEVALALLEPEGVMSVRRSESARAATRRDLDAVNEEIQ